METKAEMHGTDLLLEVWPLVLDHEGQELVLKSLLGHAEVEQRGLGVDLWLVVGVAELGLEVEAELYVVLNLVVTNLDQQVASLLDCLQNEEGVEEGE